MIIRPSCVKIYMYVCNACMLHTFIHTYTQTMLKWCSIIIIAVIILLGILDIGHTCTTNCFSPGSLMKRLLNVLRSIIEYLLEDEMKSSKVGVCCHFARSRLFYVIFLDEVSLTTSNVSAKVGWNKYDKIREKWKTWFF